MPSPNDNINMKDALSVTFKMRAKDQSAAQDGSLQRVMHLSSPYPIDYGVGGCFELVSKSSTMAAGLAGASTIYGFRWTSTTMLAIIHRLRLSMWSLGVGFTAGMGTFEMLRVTGWNADDTGGVADTLTSPAAKLRTAHAASLANTIRHSSTAAITPGTRTVDGAPMESLPVNITNVANNVFLTKQVLYEKMGAEHPLVIGQNEGFIIQATVPATGTWGFSLSNEWSEVPVTSY